MTTKIIQKSKSKIDEVVDMQRTLKSIVVWSVMDWISDLINIYRLPTCVCMFQNGNTGTLERVGMYHSYSDESIKQEKAMAQLVRATTYVRTVCETQNWDTKQEIMTSNENHKISSLAQTLSDYVKIYLQTQATTIDSHTVKTPNPHLWTVREDHIWNFRSGPMKQRITAGQMYEENITALITLDQRIQQTKWKDVADDKINKITQWITKHDDQKYDP